jgi:hypothetical protein
MLVAASEIRKTRLIMAQAHLTSKDIIRIGQQIYDRDLRKKLEKQHRGKFVFIDIETGDYEFDKDQVAAGERLRQRHPGSLLYMARIGYPAAIKLGPRFRLKRS